MTPLYTVYLPYNPPVVFICVRLIKRYGLLYGPLAARIIVDEILGHENPYAGVYAARRFTPTKSAGEFVRETLEGPALEALALLHAESPVDST